MNKKKTTIIAAAILIVIFIAIAVFYKNQENSRFSLTVGGERIQKEEYLQTMYDTMHEVTAYFKGRYKVSAGNIDWNHAYGGEVPSQVLTDRTVGKITDRISVYKVAVRQGYVDSVSYEGLLKRMKAENARRKNKIQRGETVYGLSEFSLKTYLEYEMDSFEKRFCQENKVGQEEYSDTVRAQKKNSKADADMKRLYAFTLKSITTH